MFVFWGGGGLPTRAGRGGWYSSGWPGLPGALPPTLPWGGAPCIPGGTAGQAWGCQLSNDCTKNPAFCEFNMVHLKTCDGGYGNFDINFGPLVGVVVVVVVLVGVVVVVGVATSTSTWTHLSSLASTNVVTTAPDRVVDIMLLGASCCLVAL